MCRTAALDATNEEQCRYERQDAQNEAQRAERRPARFAPKTPAGERSVEMTPLVREALAKQREKSGLNALKLVFPNTEGGEMILNNVREREWRRLVVKAKLRYRDLYQCRHSFASMALTRGDDVRHVAQQLGHSTIATVITVYSRWLSTKPTDTPQTGAATQAGAPAPDKMTA